MFRNIEAERARNGFSKEVIATKLNITPKTYYNWVYEITPIPSHKLVELSQLFKTSMDYLLESE